MTDNGSRTLSTRLPTRLAIAAAKDTQWHISSNLMKETCRISESQILEVRKSGLPVERARGTRLEDECNVTAACIVDRLNTVLG